MTDLFVALFVPPVIAASPRPELALAAVFARTNTTPACPHQQYSKASEHTSQYVLSFE